MIIDVFFSSSFFLFLFPSFFFFLPFSEVGSVRDQSKYEYIQPSSTYCMIGVKSVERFYNNDDDDGDDG